ncbi:hypothetical protein ACRALDRAFT_1063005 [Sodiomyces alcalophilus JCM 7366]|uniref:uncharacterized protein n=1 Tax=Sodiomyces alcalophilus JCM 7366 TaxID=591952 RepID=UPI0039B5799E
MSFFSGLWQYVPSFFTQADMHSQTVHTSGNFQPRPIDVVVVKAMLGRSSQMPPEVVDMIIDHAEYWPHCEAVIERPARQSIRISGGRRDRENALILRSPPVGFGQDSVAQPDEWISTQAAPQPLREAAPVDAFQKLGAATTLEHPVRKVVFTLRSRDQGWGGAAQDRGTFEGSCTWFEAGLERFEGRGEDEGKGEDEGRGEGEEKETRSPPDRPFQVADLRPVYPETEVVEDAPRYKHPISPNEQHKIQCNRTATGMVADYRIVWSWTDNTEPDSPEAEQLARRGRGKLSGSGEFVRSLRLGDVVTIWAKARFPGWANQVQKVGVEVYWAV